MMNLIIFAICSTVNVMLNTVKTIVMYNKNKLSSSLINAITYGFYTYLVILMAGDSINLIEKIILTAITNFIGVWVSMLILAKLEKDKLWRVETTIRRQYIEKACEMLDNARISYTVLETSNNLYYVMNIYSATQKESLAIKEILKKFDAKYFVSESKTL